MKNYKVILLLVWSSFVLAQDKRPNILFIMSDDHAYQAISSYDDRLIQTPNIDRLAEEGIKFTNACATNSICAPSRATILTGKFSHLNGKIDNHSPFDTSQVTFPQLFKKAGYQTAMFGKLHFGNNPKGVDDFLILPGQGDYINPKFLGKEKDKEVRDIRLLNEKISGSLLRDLKLPRDVLMLSVKRNEEIILSHGYTRLLKEDIITFLGSRNSLDKLTLRFDS